MSQTSAQSPALIATSLGKKYLMALSGLFLVSFLPVHLIGNVMGDDARGRQPVIRERVKDLLERVYEEVTAYLGVLPFFIVVSYDSQHKTMRYELFNEEGKIVPAYHHTTVARSGLTGWIIESGQMLYVRDLPAERATLPTQPIRLGSSEVRSWLGVPLRLIMALAFILTLRARNLGVVKECTEITLGPDCRVARDCDSVGEKALRRAAFVRLSPSASPLGGSVQDLLPAGRVAGGWRAGTVVASAGGRDCWTLEGRLPRLARRVCRRLMSDAAAARLRAVEASAHARLGLKDEELTMCSSRRRNWLFAPSGCAAGAA